MTARKKNTQNYLDEMWAAADKVNRELERDAEERRVWSTGYDAGLAGIMACPINDLPDDMKSFESWCADCANDKLKLFRKRFPRTTNSTGAADTMKEEVKRGG